MVSPHRFPRARNKREAHRYEDQRMIYCQPSLLTISDTVASIMDAVVPAGYTFVVDRIKFSGVSRLDTPTYNELLDDITIQVSDLASDVQVMRFASYSSTAYDSGAVLGPVQTPLNFEWRLNGALRVPAGYILRALVSNSGVTANVQVIGAMVPAREAGYLPIQKVGGFGPTDAAGTTRTQIIAGVAGKHLKLKALFVRGAGVGGNDSILLEHGNGTTYWPICRFYVKQGNPVWNLSEALSDIDIELPAGHHIYATNSTANRCTVAAIAEVEDKTRHVDPYGRHIWFGTATSGSTTTIVNSNLTGIDAWVTNQWAGYEVVCTSGTGSGQTATITSNTGTTLTFPAVTTAFDNTSVYEIKLRGGDRWWCYNTSSRQLFPTSQPNLICCEGMMLSGIGAGGAEFMGYAASGPTAAGIQLRATVGDANLTQDGVLIPLGASTAPQLVISSYNPAAGTLWGSLRKTGLRDGIADYYQP